MTAIGLVAGSGKLPFLFAEAAKAQRFDVHVVGFEGDTDPLLASHVASFKLAKLGQTRPVIDAFRAHGVTNVVFAGGIGRIRSLTQARSAGGRQRLQRLA